MMSKTSDENKFLGNDNEEFQVPVRVVMNNMTISVFTSEDYASNILSFNLDHSSFLKSKIHKNCFIIKESYPQGIEKSARFCPFGLDKANKVNQEWNYDKNMFKNKCKTNKEVQQLDSEAEVLKDDYKNKLVIIYLLRMVLEEI